MGNFQSYKKNLGVVNRGRTYDIVFTKTPDAKKISGVETGCGCTTASYEGGDVHLMWTVSQTEASEVSRVVFVNYADGTQDALTIKATVA